MPFREWLAWIEFPDEIELWSFDGFKDQAKQVKCIVREIMVRQWDLKYKAWRKTKISDDKWENIYDKIIDSDFRVPYSQHEQQLTPGFISKLSMIFGDDEIVLLFITLILSWVLSISPSQVNKFPLELETKIFDIDPLLLRRRIKREWGKIGYQGLLIDNMFDRCKNGELLLKDNGGRKLRTRTRKFVDGTKTQALVPKRKLQEDGVEFTTLLQMYIDSLWIEMDLSRLTDDMKVVLEEEMTIHDRNALEEILEHGLKLWLIKSKVKLRSSNILDGAKIEIEKYPGIKDGTWVNKWLPIFAEIEADSPEASSEIRKRLRIEHLPISTWWSSDVFDRYGAADQYITFWNWGRKDTSEFLRRDRIIDMWERLMEWDYFYNFE